MHYVPLLALQHSLYLVPAGQVRFEAYIAQVQAGAILPLSRMNPMGKPHCLALLDEYLALDTDAKIAQIVAGNLPTQEGRVALVLIDDAKGGWTNRWCVEYDLCFKPVATDWLTVPLWTSELADLHAVETNTKQAIYRTHFQKQHGIAQTLREHLRQERYAIEQSGALNSSLSAEEGEESEEGEYTRDVLSPLLENSDRPTLFAALYGDEAAVSLGYKPLGLSQRAGLSITHHLLGCPEAKPTTRLQQTKHVQTAVIVAIIPCGRTRIP
jgi:hypothetical protein